MNFLPSCDVTVIRARVTPFCFRTVLLSLEKEEKDFRSPQRLKLCCGGSSSLLWCLELLRVKHMLNTTTNWSGISEC